jgi:hypothetical protein
LALVAGGGFEAANGRRLGEFAPDSALEEAVLSELVSVRRFRAKLGKYREVEQFWLPRATKMTKFRSEISMLRR